MDLFCTGKFVSTFFALGNLYCKDFFCAGKFVKKIFSIGKFEGKFLVLGHLWENFQHWEICGEVYSIGKLVGKFLA